MGIVEHSQEIGERTSNTPLSTSTGGSIHIQIQMADLARDPDTGMDFSELVRIERRRLEATIAGPLKARIRFLEEELSSEKAAAERRQDAAVAAAVASEKAAAERRKDAAVAAAVASEKAAAEKRVAAAVSSAEARMAALASQMASHASGSNTCKSTCLCEYFFPPPLYIF